MPKAVQKTKRAAPVPVDPKEAPASAPQKGHSKGSKGQKGQKGQVKTQAKGKASPAKQAQQQKKSRQNKAKNPLFISRPRNFGIGQDIQPKRDLTRFVRWPKYIRLQRQKRVLLNRLKVPPALNQFTRTLTKNSATKLLSLLLKYRPESKINKRKRILQYAKSKLAREKALNAALRKKDGAKIPIPSISKPAKPLAVKFGLNHITSLIEQKKAKLVVIAHDVDPIELVVWLPALCRKMGVPYCIVKGKARLGVIARKKTATALAVTNVHKEHAAQFDAFVKAFTAGYNDKYDEVRKSWGGSKVGIKSQHQREKKKKSLAREIAQREKAKAATQ